MKLPAKRASGGGALVTLMLVMVPTLAPDSLAAQAGPALFELDHLTDGSSRQGPADWIVPQESRASGRLKGALIGATIGVAAGWGVYELAVNHNGICSPSPTCTVEGPSRTETMLIGGTLGLLLGAAIGSNQSRQDRTVVPGIGAGPDGGWMVSFRLPLGRD